MVLQIISWYKFLVRRINGLTKTSKLQLETRPTITAIALGDSYQDFQSLELWDQQVVLPLRHTHTVEFGGFVDPRFTGQFGRDCTT
jgi:hypothetical protein